jgi:hypothetical protein
MPQDVDTGGLDEPMHVNGRGRVGGVGMGSGWVGVGSTGVHSREGARVRVGEVA